MVPNLTAWTTQSGEDYEDLTIEVDGGQHAENECADARRSAYLEKLGYQILRFWNNEVMGNLEGVMETILAALSPSNTLPSPLVGEGPGERGSRARATHRKPG